MTVRISGLSSGMDVDSMVKELMKAENTKMESVKAKKQLLEWKQEDYRSINTKLLALRTSLFNMKLQGTFSSKTVSSSNDTVATATANASAGNGSNSITVQQLASGVYKGSIAKLGSNSTTTTLAAQFGLSGTVSFTLEGYDGKNTASKAFSFDASTQSLSNVVNEINEADLGITASYDAGADRFFLTTQGTGSSYKIQATADGNNFLTSTLKLDLTVGTTLDADDQGKDAIVDYNGVTGMTFSNNQFTLNNVTFNLKSKGTAQLTVSNNVDAAVDKIKTFVEAYNNALDLMASETSEKRYYDFDPLSDAEKEGMTEKQIETWETKAKSGMLKGDTLVNTAYSQIRGTAMGSVSNLSSGTKYNSLSSIGITTTSWYDKGKLEIDETKLRKALADDPEGVMNMFTQTQDSGTTTDTRGLAVRLYDKVNSAITSIKDRAGSAGTASDNSTIGKELARYEDRIETLQDQLDDIEERYYNKFTAMETAIEKMNSQSNYLSQMFGNLSSSSSK